MVEVVHVVSVGTSILSNVGRVSALDIPKDLISVLEEIKGRGVVRWAFARAGSIEDGEAEKHAFKGSPIFDGLLRLVEWSPNRMSAELNAIYSIIASYPGLRPNEIYLYSTDTGAGWLCAQVAFHHLKGRGFTVYEPIRVGKFGVDFGEALVSLLDRVGRVVYSKKRQGFRVYLNMTAGFKAESAFMALAGMLLGADGIYYMHESFNQPVFIPTVPVAIKGDAMELLKELSSGPMLSTRFKERFGEPTLHDFEFRGLIEMRGDWIHLRDWAKALLKLMEKQ